MKTSTCTYLSFRLIELFSHRFGKCSAPVYVVVQGTDSIEATVLVLLAVLVAAELLLASRAQDVCTSRKQNGTPGTC